MYVFEGMLCESDKDPRGKTTGYSEGKRFENPPNPLFQRGDPVVSEE